MSDLRRGEASGRSLRSGANFSVMRARSFSRLAFRRERWESARVRSLERISWASSKRR